jgi:hypothetical protein
MAPTRLVVEIDWDDDGTVTGLLTDESGEQAEFHGWLSFAAAIEDLTEHVREPN